LEIIAEETERIIAPKSEAFIVSLNKRLVGSAIASSEVVQTTAKKEWIKLTIMCDLELKENEDPFENNVLMIVTTNGYEMYVDVDNVNNTAKIRENSFEKETEMYKVTYEANGGTGSTGIKNAKKGFSVTLQDNPFEKVDYIFVGWSKNNDGNGEIYSPGNKISIEEDTTFYAIWGVKVIYNANGGSAIPEEQIKIVGKSLVLSDVVDITIPQMTGKLFLGWSKTNDSTEASYQPGDTLTEELNNDLTLYAVYRDCDFDYTGSVQTVKLLKGTYKLEVWGAQGGSYSTSYYGGKGGYSVGVLTIAESKNIYVYCGGQPEKTTTTAGAKGFNGGGLGRKTTYTTTDSEGNSSTGTTYGQGGRWWH